MGGLVAAESRRRVRVHRPPRPLPRRRRRPSPSRHRPSYGGPARAEGASTESADALELLGDLARALDERSLVDEKAAAALELHAHRRRGRRVGGRVGGPRLLDQRV